MRTNDLKLLVQSKLKTVAANVYHEIANEKALYPHIVFSFRRLDLNDLSRQDYILEVDIWDRAKDWKNIEEIADQIEALFNDVNLPQPTIYPTFFRENRYSLDDPDKNLQHIQLRFLVQLYEEV